MNGHAFTRGLGRAAGIVVIAAGAAAAQQQQQGAAQWGPIQGQVYENQLQEALEADRTRLRQVRVPVTPARAPLPLGHRYRALQTEGQAQLRSQLPPRRPIIVTGVEVDGPGLRIRRLGTPDAQAALGLGTHLMGELTDPAAPTQVTSRFQTSPAVIDVRGPELLVIEGPRLQQQGEAVRVRDAAWGGPEDRTAQQSQALGVFTAPDANGQRGAAIDAQEPSRSLLARVAQTQQASQQAEQLNPEGFTRLGEACFEERSPSGGVAQVAQTPQGQVSILLAPSPQLAAEVDALARDLGGRQHDPLEAGLDPAVQGPQLVGVTAEDQEPVFLVRNEQGQPERRVGDPEGERYDFAVHGPLEADEVLVARANPQAEPSQLAAAPSLGGQQQASGALPLSGQQQQGVSASEPQQLSAEQALAEWTRELGEHAFADDEAAQQEAAQQQALASLLADEADTSQAGPSQASPQTAAAQSAAEPQQAAAQQEARAPVAGGLGALRQIEAQMGGDVASAEPTVGEDEVSQPQQASSVTAPSAPRQQGAQTPLVNRPLGEEGPTAQEESEALSRLDQLEAQAELSQATAQAEPSQATAQAEPSQATAQAEPSQATAQAEPSQATAQAEPSQAPAQAEPSQAPAQSEPSQATAQSEPSQATAQAEPSQAPAQAEPSQASALAQAEPSAPAPVAVGPDGETRPLTAEERAQVDQDVRELQATLDQIRSEREEWGTAFQQGDQTALAELRAELDELKRRNSELEREVELARQRDQADRDRLIAEMEAARRARAARPSPTFDSGPSAPRSYEDYRNGGGTSSAPPAPTTGPNLGGAGGATTGGTPSSGAGNAAAPAAGNAGSGATTDRTALMRQLVELYAKINAELELLAEERARQLQANHERIILSYPPSMRPYVRARLEEAMRGNGLAPVSGPTIDESTPIVPPNGNAVPIPDDVTITPMG